MTVSVKGFGGGSGAEVIPVGAIIMWNGENIPDNWHLCDGTNGTPDLRDKFIVGSGASYAVGNTGGENTHTLTLDEIPEHEHNLTLAKTVSSNNNYNDISTMAIKQGTNLCTLESLKASGVSTSSLPISSEENGNGHENRPPYYALAFIMYIGATV